MDNLNCTTVLCSREIMCMLLVGQVSGLVRNFNTGIFSDTINEINVKFCMMALNIELYLFIIGSLTWKFQGHSSVKQF